jgi:hypothetical protein
LSSTKPKDFPELLPGLASRDLKVQRHIRARAISATNLQAIEVAKMIRTGGGVYRSALSMGCSAILGAAFRDGGDTLLYGTILQTQWASAATIRHGVETVLGVESAIEWMDDRVEWGELYAIQSLAGNGGFRISMMAPAEWAEREPREVVLDWINSVMPSAMTGARRDAIKSIAKRAREYLASQQVVDPYHHLDGPPEFNGLMHSRTMGWGK